VTRVGKPEGAVKVHAGMPGKLFGEKHFSNQQVLRTLLFDNRKCRRSDGIKVAKWQSRNASRPFNVAPSNLVKKTAHRSTRDVQATHESFISIPSRKVLQRRYETIGKCRKQDVTNVIECPP
jgi:hypothetical protein